MPYCETTQIETPTPIGTRHTTSHQFIWQQQYAAQWADHQWNAEWAESRHRHLPLGMTLRRRAWVRLNRLRTGVGRFRSCLYKWGMACFAACECDAEEQTVDHVVLQCQIHRPPHRLHGLTVLDDETTEWLLNICPESSEAEQWFEQLAQKKKWNHCVSPAQIVVWSFYAISTFTYALI